MATQTSSDSTLAFGPPRLSWRERFFLRFWCFPPPVAPFEPRDSLDPVKQPIDPDPLGRVRRVYGDRFENAIRGRVMLDIGCGPGAQVLGAAQAGAKLAVGVDRTQVSLDTGVAHAKALGLADRTRFTTDTVATMGIDWADVALSQNSFEHFDDPLAILAQVYNALKPGGQFFVTFGPPWWHPYGVHHMFMIRLPWAHVVFSEKTILSVRRLYRPDRPRAWREVSLNQMSIAKLLHLIKKSKFELTHLSVTPIGPIPRWLARLPLFREWTTSDVSLILTKPNCKL